MTAGQNSRVIGGMMTEHPTKGRIAMREAPHLTGNVAGLEAGIAVTRERFVKGSLVFMWLDPGALGLTTQSQFFIRCAK